MNRGSIHRRRVHRRRAHRRGDTRAGCDALLREAHRHATSRYNDQRKNRRHPNTHHGPHGVVSFQDFQFQPDRSLATLRVACGRSGGSVLRSATGGKDIQAKSVRRRAAAATFKRNSRMKPSPDGLQPTSSAKTLAHQLLHPRERGARASNDALFFRAAEFDPVKRGDEGLPVQAAAFGSGRQMPRAEPVVEAELRGLLQQKRRAEIRALRDIQPAERGRDIGFTLGAGRRRKDRRCARMRRIDAEIGQILRD